MNTKTALFGIWLAGFMLGFAGYLAYPVMANLLLVVLPAFTIDGHILRASLSGMVGSFITLLAVLVWAKISR